MAVGVVEALRLACRAEARDAGGGHLGGDIPGGGAEAGGRDEGKLGRRVLALLGAVRLRDGGFSGRGEKVSSQWGNM